MTHFLKDLSRSRAGLFGFVLLVVIVALALLAPLLDLPDPTRGDLRARLAGPTWEGLFSPGRTPWAPTKWAATSSRG